MKDIKKFLEKVQQDLPEFVEAVLSLSTEELNARLAQLSKDNEANDDARDADEELEKTKALATELGAPYRDARKHIKLKNGYILYLLKDRGN